MLLTLICSWMPFAWNPLRPVHNGAAFTADGVRFANPGQVRIASVASLVAALESGEPVSIEFEFTPRELLDPQCLLAIVPRDDPTHRLVVSSAGGRLQVLGGPNDWGFNELGDSPFLGEIHAATIRAGDARTDLLDRSATRIQAWYWRVPPRLQPHPITAPSDFGPGRTELQTEYSIWMVIVTLAIGAALRTRPVLVTFGVAAALTLLLEAGQLLFDGHEALAWDVFAGLIGCAYATLLLAMRRPHAQSVANATGAEADLRNPNSRIPHRLHPRVTPSSFDNRHPSFALRVVAEYSTPSTGSRRSAAPNGR